MFFFPIDTVKLSIHIAKRFVNFLSTCGRRLGAARIVYCDRCPKAQKKVFELKNGYPSPQTQSVTAVTALVCSCELSVEKHDAIAV